MKQTKILFLLLAVLLFCGFASSCNLVNGSKSTADTSVPAMASSDPVPEGSVPSQTPSASPISSYSFMEKKYSDGTIIIKYPQITGLSDSSLRDKLNKLIGEAAFRNLDDVESGAVYELKYQVTWNTPAVISLYYTGYVNVPGAAHPSEFLRSVSIDTAKQETIKFTDLIKVNSAFVTLMLGGQYSSMAFEMTEEYQTSIKEYLTGLEDAFWINELINADTPGHEVSSYLTKDGLVLSVAVPHAMGDHVEILLQYKDISVYKTENPIWKAIEG